MTSKLHLVLSMVVGGFAIHGAITACGKVSPSMYDAGRNDDARADAPASSDAGVPAGTIMAYGGLTIPSGWIVCDGTAVSRTSYASLFGAIGINFGGGDGISTFNLPDLRGRFLRGVDGGAGHDPDAASRTASNPGGPVGNAVGTLQADSTAAPATPFVAETTGAHTHTNGQFDRLSLHDGVNTTNGTALDNVDGGAEPNLATTAPLLTAGAHTHRIGGGFGTGGDKETRPRNVAVQYIIKI